MCLTTFLCMHVNTYAQTQKGTDIDGEAAGDNAGKSVSMPDAGTVAIGAPYNDGNGTSAGQVRIYSWNGTAWVQKGIDIDGALDGEDLGWSVSMPDASTVAIGSPFVNDFWHSGLVRIYSWNGTAWVQKGTNINGEAYRDQSGKSVSMPDAGTVAIGAHNNDGNGILRGHVRIYSWNGTAWVQKGTDINGEADYDYSGSSVSMPDAGTVAIAAPYNDGNGSNSGHVRIYSWNGTAWVQKGTDINGDGPNDYFGSSVSMPDASTVAIGSVFNDAANGYNSGYVRIYSWNGTGWVQKGTDIEGEAAGDYSGCSVSMPNAGTVAIGAHCQNNPIRSGYVRIYSWNGTAWVQEGTDIDGESSGDYSGCSVSMPDAGTVAIGARYNDGNGTDAGHVRIYDGIPLGIHENDFDNTLLAYPNPTDGIITIDLGNTYKDIAVTIKNILGQEVNKLSSGNKSKLQLSTPEAAGVYFVELNAGNKRAVLKVIKK